MKLIKISVATLFAGVLLAGCGGSSTSTIGGTVNGLASGNSVTLTNGTNGDTVTYTYNTSSNTFTFPKSLNDNDSYNVTVTTQPTNQTCSVTNGVGTINSNGGNVTNIDVTCNSSSGTTVPLQANVSGLAANATLILYGAAPGTLTVTGNATTAANQTVSFNFPNPLAAGAVYNVTIQTQPTTGPQCTILNNSGQGSVPTSGNPSPVAVSCP